ncbi:MAG: 30S ribosomal protein S21 [Chitinophagales bacterium]|nr:30S ribosomal protein S21 [Bacteroidota bacterium]MCB9043947.1 30S ribosomal protein S21 [Chitinophagales bacterium]
MLIIHVKAEEKIDYALKRYKQKQRRTQLVQELRERKYFTKPSMKKRQQQLKAEYKNKYYSENNN